MTDLLRTPLADRTQDLELEGVDFFSPVQVMGAYASKEVAPPKDDDKGQEEDYEVPYYGD